MVVFDSAALYIESQTGIKAKIVAIDAIIDALLVTAAKAATNDHLTEYSLNDGQVQIKSAYRGASAIFNSIKEFEKLKQIYMSRINGRVVRLVDSKNFY
jgi:hypothetical protein